MLSWSRASCRASASGPSSMESRAPAGARRLRPERRRGCRDRGRGRRDGTRPLRAGAGRRGAVARSGRRRVETWPRVPLGETEFRIARSEARRQHGADPGGRRDVRRLPARALRPGRPPLPVPVHQLHPMRAALHDRAAASPTTGRDDDGWVPALRRLPPRVRGSRSTGASTPSRSPAPSAARDSRSDSRTRCAGPAPRGAILAVKGLGGYHLACDAADEAAVARLRARKHREDKPFAVMTNAPERLADLNERREALLRSRERPIVLVRRRAVAGRARRSRPGRPWLGVMLPYTPLHHLLLAEVGGTLVMTSGNRSDEPIAYEDDEARARLGGIADAFLAHDRPIHRRCEDSVVAARPSPFRRSRGYVPGALPLPVAARRPLVAAGAELKSTFCVARGAQRVPFAASRRPRLGAGLPRVPHRSRALPRDARRRAGGDRARPAPRVPGDEVGARAGGRARRACSTTTRMPLRASPSTARAARRSRSSSTAPATAPTARSGAASCCVATCATFERLAHLDPVPLPGGEAAIRRAMASRRGVPRAGGPPGPVGALGRVRHEPEA